MIAMSRRIHIRVDTYSNESFKGVHMSVNEARTSACATMP
jgi:hypothetical protein